MRVIFAVVFLMLSISGVAAEVGKRLATEWKPIDPVQLAAITQSGAIYRFECYVAKIDVTRIVELNSDSQQVRVWSKASAKLTVGPFGPYSATITSETITWNKKNEDSNTKYTLDRKTKTLKTEIIYNIMDEPLREIASC